MKNQAIFTTSWDDGHPLDARVAELLSEAGFPLPGVPQDVAQFACNWETNLNDLILRRDAALASARVIGNK